MCQKGIASGTAGAWLVTGRLVKLMILLSGIALVGGTERANAQEARAELVIVRDTNVVQQVELRDGTGLTGRVIGIEGEWITFLTMEGSEVRFRRSDVKSVRETPRPQAGSDTWPRDGSDSRLFVMPTARVPEHGHGYVGVHEFSIPSAGVGLFDLAMITGGVVVVPMFPVGMYLSGKIRFLNLKHVQAAAGAMLLRAREFGGVLFAAVTAGSDIASFTGSLAVPVLIESDFGEQPFVSLGGEMRVSKSVKLMTENWIMPGDDALLLGFGARYISGNFTGEGAGVLSFVENSLYPVPVINFAYTW